jgi:ABC-type lipoprotein release transport system permease subunit
MILSVIHIGLAELTHRWREAVLMAGIIAVSILSVLLLNAYRQGMEDRYARASDSYLVVQQSGSMGEIQGSRLPASNADQLTARGASLVVPQLHTIIGTSPENSVLLRGIPLETYAQVESFRIIAGRPLDTGDAPRHAMVGAALAESKNVGPGSTIMLRGRPFTVIGIFSVGTYANFEAWIPLPEAQRLLGWESEVSVFIIPAGEGLSAGDELPGGISIVPRGQAADTMLAEWEPLFQLLGLVAGVLALAAAIALTNMLWRLAWLRRRQFAILGSLGYGRLELTTYLLAQSAGITLLAYVLGLSAALFFTSFSQIQGLGLTLKPVISPSGAILALVIAAVIALGASAIPAWWLSKYNLLELLRADI